MAASNAAASRAMRTNLAEVARNAMPEPSHRDTCSRVHRAHDARRRTAWQCGRSPRNRRTYAIEQSVGFQEGSMRGTSIDAIRTGLALIAGIAITGAAHADVLDDVKTNGTLKCGVTLA